ncbi:MAG: AraC family transcriptional regulator [Cyanosarcina radialis HA8281-LM2]|jgi:AraC-like DNA-binding protein|nr:AraC family transcriptional regulator [Cyanosarcina radialis HA8281-LM2]
MTISISQAAYDELFDEMSAIEPSRHPDGQDERDFMGKISPVLGQGSWRKIALRDGLELSLGNLQIHDRIVTFYQETETDWLELHLHLSGVHDTASNQIGAGEYGVYGSGLSPWMSMDISDRQAFQEVMVFVRVDVLRSFIGDSEGELPAALQSWVRPSEQQCYSFFSTATPAMQLAARQMLRCSFQGMAKRMFLEGKALELLGLVAAVEMDRYGAERSYLQGDVIDRIHHARDILRQQLDNPPSLGELSRLVGLNDCTLKQGFRNCFGTTVFGYLYDYRMKQARQALEMGEGTVGEVARMVGYSNLPAFSRAFSKRFGIKPRDCLGKNCTW